MKTKMSKQDLIDFEKKIAEKFDNGDISYLIHLSGGNEDQLIDIFKNEINEGDYIFSTHRSHYHYLLCGGYPDDLEDKILNGKSMFVFNRELNFLSSSIVAATPSIAAGVAWALKKKGSEKKVWCFIGDGGEDEGHFYEAVRYVDGWDLPCFFVIEDNDRNVSASKKERRGNSADFNWPGCVRRYTYVPTYPHGGSGGGKWIKFKKEPKIVEPPKKRSSEIPDLLLECELMQSSVNSLRNQGSMTNHLFAQIPSSNLTSQANMLNYLSNSPLTYFDAVKKSMEMLAKECNAIFIGYNVRHGSAYGSFKDIPESQKLETPLAENLMAGLAMGMSLEGFRPVLFFERHEFVLNAIDAIVNTMNIIETISDGQFTMPVIIKIVAGSIKPFYAGLTHTQNLTNAFRTLVSFPVYQPKTPQEVLKTYELARFTKTPVMISELKEFY